MSSRTVRARTWPVAQQASVYITAVAEDLDSFGPATIPDNNTGTQQQEHAAAALRICSDQRLGPWISGHVLISHRRPTARPTLDRHSSIAFIVIDRQKFR